jgi:hypothetical protein
MEGRGERVGSIFASRVFCFCCSCRVGFLPGGNGNPTHRRIPTTPGRVGGPRGKAIKSAELGSVRCGHADFEIKTIPVATGGLSAPLTLSSGHVLHRAGTERWSHCGRPACRATGVPRPCYEHPPGGSMVIRHNFTAHRFSPPPKEPRWGEIWIWKMLRI